MVSDVARIIFNKEANPRLLRVEISREANQPEIPPTATLPDSEFSAQDKQDIRSVIDDYIVLVDSNRYTLMTDTFLREFGRLLDAILCARNQVDLVAVEVDRSPLCLDKNYPTLTVSCRLSSGKGVYIEFVSENKVYLTAD